MLSIEQQLHQHPAVFCKRLQCLQCKKKKKRSKWILVNCSDIRPVLQTWWLGFLCLCVVLVLTGSWLSTPTFLLRLTTHENNQPHGGDVIAFKQFSILHLSFCCLLYCSCANTKLPNFLLRDLLSWNRNLPLHLQVSWASKPDHQLQMLNILALKKKNMSLVLLTAIL